MVEYANYKIFMNKVELSLVKVIENKEFCFFVHEIHMYLFFIIVFS